MIFNTYLHSWRRVLPPRMLAIFTVSFFTAPTELIHPCEDPFDNGFLGVCLSFGSTSTEMVNLFNSLSADAILDLIHDNSKIRNDIGVRVVKNQYSAIWMNLLKQKINKRINEKYIYFS